MREMKFRAWSDLTKQMTYFDFKHENVHISRLHVAMFADEIQRDGILMQFTGLKDKNGKEAFEGDIVKVESNIITLWSNKPTGKVSTRLCKIQWVDGGWGYTAFKNVQNYPGTIPNTTREIKIMLSYGTIVGNIYENPELLK